MREQITTRYAQRLERYKLQMMGEMLQDISPSAHKAIDEIAMPFLTDPSHLPFIYAEIERNEGGISSENKPFVCAVLCQLYSPLHLFTKKVKLPIGLV